MRVTFFPFAALAGLVAHFPVVAQDNASDPLAELRQCRDIAENEARLACYDRQTADLLTAEASGDLKLVDREKAQETRKSRFGYSGAKVPFFDEGDEVSEIESTITQVRRYGRDGWLITIEDGDAVWRIANAPMGFSAPRAGDKITIRRGALNSYFIRVRTQIGVKGRRVE